MWFSHYRVLLSNVYIESFTGIVTTPIIQTNQAMIYHVAQTNLNTIIPNIRACKSIHA